MSLSPQNLWALDEHALLKLLNSGVFKPISREIRFYNPSFTYYRTKHYSSNNRDFPTISVTGNACALGCKHCGGKVLQTMHPAVSPQELFNLGVKLKLEGAKGFLISGGCLSDGSIPLDGFVPILERFKRELNLTVFVHTGIVGVETAFSLKAANVDAVLIDVIGSEATVKEIYNLNVSLQDYKDSLAALNKAGLAVVPHVIVGLNGGNLEGELAALQMINRFKPAALVIIAFMPIRGTEMAQTPPPKPLDIAKVVACARILFPKVPLTLGCMRPKGKNRAETDVLALQAGVDGIAFPSNEAIEFALKADLKFSFSSYCCAQLYLDSNGQRF
ncbi:MAG TPA: radical SAM protein [Candidatus Deferrimicrobiaceae bacterium]|nr:radical SAM protein [Candidatus Deferrimicrobiaceae bacterium]